MNTYVPPEKQQGQGQNALKSTGVVRDNGDLMLEGGFDSFSSDQGVGNAMPLGSVDYGAIQQDRAEWNRHSGNFSMSFWKQLGSSLIPPLYRSLQYRTKQQAIQYIKTYVRIMMGIMLGFMAIVMLMALSQPSMFAGGETALSGASSTIMLLQLVIIGAVSMTLGVWITVLLYRIAAWILSLFGKLFAAIARKSFVRDQVYVAALYIVVFPYMVSNLVMNAMSVVWFRQNISQFTDISQLTPLSLYAVVPVAVCLIYMLLAVIFMKSDD